MENQQAPTVRPQAHRGLAIASMVMGIVAALTGLIYLGGVLGILAIIFGIIALSKKTGKGMAIAGIVTGGLGILGTIVATVVLWIAVPALQQDARDTSRKNQIGLVVSEIQDFQANHRGQLPDPEALSQSYQTITLKFAGNGEPTTSTAIYQAGINCDGESSSRAFNVTVKLENGEIYCQGS